MAREYSTMVPLDTEAVDFELKGTDGNIHSLDSFQDKKILVIVFMCNHCPYVQATLQRMIDLHNAYAGRGAQFVGINANDTARYPDDSFENMQKLVREKNIPFPYLLDETQEIARRYNAVCTPDIYVYGPDRKLKYRGRIDDNWEDPGQVTRQDLKEAIETLLAGREAPEEQIPSMGCSIKWKQN